MEQEIERILVRNLSGEASCEDIFIFSEWLSSSEAHKESFLQIKKYWDAEVTGAKLRNPEATYNKLLDRIRKAERRNKVRKLWIKYASAAAAALLIGVAGYWMGNGKSVAPVRYYSYITGNSVSTFELPDGTEVALNKNSTLSYSGAYGETAREVSLEGEGFFSVTKDTAKAFVVDLDGSKVAVLGTVFNVKNYKEEGVTTATLVEGSIRFEIPGRQVLLEPDQQLVFTKSTHQIEMKNVSAGLVTAWKNRLIKYKSIPFSRFVDMLEEQYGVEIVLSNQALANRTVTGAFDQSLTVNRILDLMKKNLSFTWEKQGDKYVIH